MHAKLTLEIDGKRVTRVYDFARKPSLMHIVVEPHSSKTDAPEEPKPQANRATRPWWKRD